MLLCVLKYVYCERKVSGGQAVMKSRGPGLSPDYYECSPRLLLLENRRKMEPKEIPSCLIPYILVVFTEQHRILVVYRLCEGERGIKVFLRVHVTLIPASLPFAFGLFSIKNLAHRCKFKPFLYCLNPGDGKEMYKKRDARAKLLFC